MKVKNHRIDSIWHKQSSNLSAGTIAPRLIVTHYTTGWSGTGSRDWLLGAAGGSDNTGTSAHVVIDRDGTAWQIAPFNRKAWHAGKSRYGSLSGLNAHSIGLEFVNPGWLKPAGDGQWIDYYGTKKTTAQLEQFGGFVLQPHSTVGSGTFAWPLFTNAQIAIGLEIARAIIAKYDIRAVVTHEEIDTRGWKTDPGPAFPQSTFVDLLNPGADQEGDPRYTVNTTRLNIRGGPGVEHDQVDPPGYLPLGTVVSVLRRSGNWAFVEVAETSGQPDAPEIGVRGWVHGGYLDMDFGD